LSTGQIEKRRGSRVNEPIINRFGHETQDAQKVPKKLGILQAETESFDSERLQKALARPLFLKIDWHQGSMKI
jgi:hypothetical protein